MYIDDKFNMTIENNIFCAKRVLVDSIYKQANLEGIAVTYAQTQDIINNVNVQQLSPTDINKICCLRDTWKYLLDTIDEPLNLRYLQNVHELVARFDVPYIYLGKLRTEEAMISGTDWRPEYSDAEIIHSTIQEALHSTTHITDTAIKLGLYIMRTQPFKDGNKRIGSFVINKILISNGKGIFNVPVKLDGEFKQRLVDYYESNDANSLVSWISDNCLQGVEEPKIDKNIQPSRKGGNYNETFITRKNG